MLQSRRTSETKDYKQPKVSTIYIGLCNCIHHNGQIVFEWNELNVSKLVACFKKDSDSVFLVIGHPTTLSWKMWTTLSGIEKNC